MDPRSDTRRPSAGEVASELRRQIVDFEYLHNERLPSERSLSEGFGVARATLREALRQLEETGLLERRAGSGSYVIYQSPARTEPVADTTSPLQLIDARVALEPQIARLAVLHGTERDIAALETSIRTMEGCAGDAAVFSPADDRFHLALAECTRNPLLIGLSRQVNEVRRNAQWMRMRAVTLTPRMIEHYNRQHREVFEAIGARSAERAARAMHAHLASAHESLVDAASN